MPNKINAKFFLSFIYAHTAKTQKNVYIASHCPHNDEFIITNGEKSTATYAIIAFISLKFIQQSYTITPIIPASKKSNIIEKILYPQTGSIDTYVIIAITN